MLVFSMKIEMSLFFSHEADQLATMSQAQAEHIRNSGGQRLYDDGGGDDDHEAIRGQRRPTPQAKPDPEMDWDYIDF